MKTRVSLKYFVNDCRSQSLNGEQIIQKLIIYFAHLLQIGSQSGYYNQHLLVICLSFNFE